MIKRTKNGGFSLIELIIAIAILMVLGGSVFLGIGAAKRKDADRYASELCNQIRLMQTVSMSKAGRWRLALYERDGKYYCVQEKAGADASDPSAATVWSAQSEELPMGTAGPIIYQNRATLSGDGGDGGTLIGEWRFHKDTGACTVGDGSMEIISAGETQIVTVYGMSGHCEKTSQ